MAYTKYDIAVSAMNILTSYRNDLKHSVITFEATHWAGGFPVVYSPSTTALAGSSYAFDVRISLTATDPSGSGLLISPNYALYILNGMKASEKVIENRSISALSADVTVAKLAASAEALAILNSLT